MVAVRRVLTAVLLVLAVGVVAAGWARAVDLGAGNATVRTASADHNAHQRAQRSGAARKHDRHRAGAETPPAALDDGRYAIRLDEQVVPVASRRLGFTIVDTRTGRPLTAFADDMTKKLHLIVIRADLTGFQHVHPSMSPDGRWTVDDAVLDRAGPWRLIADFIPLNADRTVLATNVHASGGPYLARPLGESPRDGEATWRTATDGYKVTLEAGDYAGGTTGELRFTIRRGGRPVRDLQPYLGAQGHAVLLRAGDVAYVHVHPEEPEAEEPGTIHFGVTYPRAAPLAVFLQFRHRGRVHTAGLRLPEPPVQGD